MSTIFRQSGSILPPEFLSDRDIEIARFSIAVDRDLRDDNFYPTKGSHFDATLTTGHFLNGRGRTYTKAVVLARRYIPVWKSGVLAGQFALCGADNSAPFFDACALGGVDAFRGYPATQFIGDALTSAQLEYRGRLTKRLGFVVFAGAGLVADDLAGLSSADLKTAGGLGARIRLSQSFPVDYSIDVSVNDQSEELLYVYVGQRF